MRYTIHGWTMGGWDVKDEASSLKAAKALARITMGGFTPSGSHVKIERDSIPVCKWSGTADGKWTRVTV